MSNDICLCMNLRSAMRRLTRASAHNNPLNAENACFKGLGRPEPWQSRWPAQAAPEAGQCARFINLLSCPNGICGVGLRAARCDYGYPFRTGTLVAGLTHMKPFSIQSNLSRRSVNRGLALCLTAGAVAPFSASARELTPSQVQGPFYPVDGDAERDIDLTRLEGHSEAATGEQILVRGIVSAADGDVLSGAVVDIWQANHHGRYSHPRDANTAPLDPNFQGWGVMKTSGEGAYGFRTIKPGAYPLSFLGGSGWRCRHIHFKVSCPGYRALTTQMYFEGDPLIAQDTEIARAPAESRHLLIASATRDEASELPLYRFDIVLAPAG